MGIIGSQDLCYIVTHFTSGAVSGTQTVSPGRSSELLGSAPSSELQALLSSYKSAACWQESPLLRSSEVKNSELWLQMAPASAVCGELGLPSLERGSTMDSAPLSLSAHFEEK